WLLIKEKDDQAQTAADYDVLEALPNSVLTGQPLTPKKRAAAKSAAVKKPAAKAAARTRSSLPTDAVKAALPATLAPELATLVSAVPEDDGDWLYEIKFDGYRLMTRIDGKTIQCFTRNGHDWSAKLQPLVKTLSQLGLKPGWLDGEIVVHRQDGVPDFGALQTAFDSASTAQIVYYVFDLPFYAGHDLRQVPLVQRRELLRGLVSGAGLDHLRFSETFESGGQDLLDSAARLGLEGVIGKRAASTYLSRRSTDWIKVKTQQRQEFVIGGYTEPQGSRTGLGALLLGVYNDRGELKHVGNVGTGFNEKTLKSLLATLTPLSTPRTAFAGLPSSVKGHWVKPTLVVEVAFAQWTHAGNIRHAVFQGLRSDKPARKVARESALPVEKVMPSTNPAAAKKAAAKRPAAKKAAETVPPVSTGKLRVTHPERVIDPGTGFTKLELIEHYARVAPLILPHLKARPVALVRAPDGITGELFFQKHADTTSIPGIQQLDPKFDPGHGPLLAIATAETLLAAAQLNVMEFHTWNATTRAIGKPDRMTLDLDPGEGVSWAQVQESAQLVQAFLKELGLPCFLKTSGGKGLHVVVPLKPSFDWDTVKEFSQAIVQHLSSVIPERFVTRSGPRNRVGKIFPDYLRNGFGATTVCAWSVRARPGMGVSVPIAWEELAGLTGAAHWDARNIGERLAVGNSPWEAYESSRATLSAAMKAMDFKPAAAAKAAKARSRKPSM
ncbi:MAG: DNA ligase D, partial [Polaromonas sp.]|nr:DNA ligase D [Polaromonas sp.]